MHGVATSSQYDAYVRGLGRERVLAAWADVKAGRQPAEAPEPWDRGHGFEYLILRAFELELAGQPGSAVEYPTRVAYADVVGTGGSQRLFEEVDGAVFAHGLSSLVECKVMDLVDATPVAELFAKLRRRPGGTIGSLVVFGQFTEAASTLAQFLAPEVVLLWNADDVELCFARQAFLDGLQWKHRAAVTRGAVYESLVDTAFGARIEAVRRADHG